MTKKNKDSADGKTAETAMHSRVPGIKLVDGQKQLDADRDVEQGAVEETNVEKAEDMEMAEEGGDPVRLPASRETEAISSSGSSDKEKDDDILPAPKAAAT